MPTGKNGQPSLRTAYLATMRRAIRERRMTEIDYLSLTDEPPQRLARPLGLTVFDHAWLLTIWCETANGFRHLRADRIHRFHPLPVHFRPESGKRLADCHRIEGRGPANAPENPEKPDDCAPCGKVMHCDAGVARLKTSSQGNRAGVKPRERD